MTEVMCDGGDVFVGTKGLRWPGLSLPLPKPKYGENWVRSKDLGPRTISDAEWKWENAAVDRELPGEW